MMDVCNICRKNLSDDSGKRYKLVILRLQFTGRRTAHIINNFKKEMKAPFRWKIIMKNKVSIEKT